MKRLKGGKTMKATTKIGADGKPESAFVCISDDDSIGSASDLKARINDELEDYGELVRGQGLDRCGEDISETVSSSVYHAECESVTTHEEDPRITGTTDPTLASKRGPKPSRASIRARTNAKLELEKKKLSNPDRLLGHEYGEKPLLLDDELDSGGEDEKGRNEEPKSQYKEEPVISVYETSIDNTALINLQSPSPPVPVSTSISSSHQKTSDLLAPSAPSAVEELSDDDVFALAPFRMPLQNASSILQSNSSVNSQLSTQILDEQPFDQPISNFSSASVERSDPVLPDLIRRPVKTHVIYEESLSEEFPIYENVTLNAKCPIPESEEPHIVYNRIELSKTSMGHNNPFTNPFFRASASVSEASESLPQTDCRSNSSKDVMSQSVDSLTLSQPVVPNNLSKASSHSSTDLFGSTPFGSVDCSNKNTVSVRSKESTPVPLSNKAPVNALSSLSPRVTPRPKTSHYYSPPADSSVPYHAITSTPRNNKACESPTTNTFNEDIDDEDLFGSVPFKPIFGNTQRSFLGLKSRTLPANMTSTFQSQMNHMGKEESSHTPTDIFKTPKASKKITPPSFRKPRLTHQILTSDSESSTESLGSGNSFSLAVVSAKKSKNRDRSKDRLKYKNIKDEFEEENTMVLPQKQFSLSRKDKHSKKYKKQDKTEKLEKAEKFDKKAEKRQDKSDRKFEKLEKKSEKSDKKYEKIDKKSEKNDKKTDKVDKFKVDKKFYKIQSYEAAGISNMSFEDQSVADDQRNRLTSARNSVASPDDGEEAGDLRTTGGNRFGSLKRGINPFSKLSNRI